jgi:hypothetical protein
MECGQNAAFFMTISDMPIKIIVILYCVLENRPPMTI